MFPTIPSYAVPENIASVHAGDGEEDFHQVVFIGASGLRWADVTAERTPHIAKFAQASAVGNLVTRGVRTSACPADGWLAFSAGNRAGDSINGAGSACRYLEEPSDAAPTTNESALMEARVPQWSVFQEAVAEQKYSAVLGSTGEVLLQGGIDTAAVGPGAAIALAQPDGRVVGPYFARPAAAGQIGFPVGQALDVLDGANRFLAVDAGHIRVSSNQSLSDPVVLAQFQEIDERVDSTLRAIYADDPRLEHTTIVLASLADPMGAPRLSILAMAGKDVEGNFLTSPSTRQAGYSQATDVPTTIFNLLDVDYSAQRSTFVGSSIGVETVPGTATERIDALIDDETHALAARPLVGTYFLIFCIVNILLFASVSYVFSGRFLRRVTRSGTWIARHSRALIKCCEVAGIALASLPVATLLANLFPWWRAAAPVIALTGICALIIGIIVGVTMLPIWRAWRFGPIGIVALITAVTLAVDIATGAQLQISALMGVQPMVGGRFYGFNNHAFTLFAVSTVLLAGAIANELVARNKRKLAGLAVALVGVGAILLDGSPSLGADFGGPPALFPAFAMLTLVALGIKISWKKAVGILAAAVFVVSSFAVLDWLRPADQRTHLGRFVDTVLDGGFFDVVGRKLAANFSTFTNPLSLVAITGVLVILIVLGRPVRLAAREANTLAPYHWLTHGVPLKQIATDTPMFLPTVHAVYVALAIGTLVNDSGVVILGIGLAVLVPLLIATYARWILGLARPQHPQSAVTSSPDPSAAPTA